LNWGPTTEPHVTALWNSGAQPPLEVRGAKPRRKKEKLNNLAYVIASIGPPSPQEEVGLP